MKLLAETRVTLVITDIFMPGQDGIVTLRRIKKEFPGVRVIAVSGGDATGRIDLRRDAELLGATRTLRKPFAPAEFVRFLQAVVRRGRQGQLGEIAQQYHSLVDVKLNRVHAGVTLLEQPDARLEQEVVQRLSRVIGKEVHAHFRADPGILGGVVVRVGDRIYDGSVRRKLATLRRKLLSGE